MANNFPFFLQHSRIIYKILIGLLSIFLLLEYIPLCSPYCGWVTPPVSLFFIVAMIVNTYILGTTDTGVATGNIINSLARKALTVTLLFIGASLSRKTLQQVGFKPMIQGILLWIIISVSTLAYILL